MSNRRLCPPVVPLAALLAGLVAGCVAPGPIAATKPDAPAPASDLVTLAPIFSDHAVLQRGKPLPVWGHSGPGNLINVTFHGQTARTIAGPDGRWKVAFPPLEASAVPEDLVVVGHNTVTLHDIVVGEVWLCSGQSNMQFTLNGDFTFTVDNVESELAAAHYPMIRQVEVRSTTALSPRDTVKTTGWEPATPETVRHFSAVGYFFARDIHEALGVPVGIILSAWGGTPVESWVSDEAREATSVGAAIDARWVKQSSEWTPEKAAENKAAMEEWRKAGAIAAAAHTKNPVKRPPHALTNDSAYRPGNLYNAMIAPLEPDAIRGFLWYQGEQNVGSHTDEYGEMFAALIRSWRAAWGQGDLPFYFVQLANLDDKGAPNNGWAWIREGQANALSLPNTGMAVAVDIGEAHNIHPRNKQEVGRRLALIAKAQVYGVPPEFSGPIFASATREGNALRVRFTHAGAELSAHGGPVTALELAGADKVFHPATAVIQTDSLLVSSPDVSDPVAVRYAWTNNPPANLYNDSGLPAAPFRSDNW